MGLKITAQRKSDGLEVVSKVPFWPGLLSGGGAGVLAFGGLELLGLSSVAASALGVVVFVVVFVVVLFAMAWRSGAKQTEHLL